MIGDQSRDSELIKRLARANHFSLKSLETNRNGQLSDDQIAQLWRSAGIKLIGGPLLAVIGVSGIVLVIQSQRLNKVISIFLAFALGAVFAGAILLWNARFDLLDAIDRRVAVLEGKIKKSVQIEKLSYHSSNVYCYHIKGQTFVVSQLGYNTLPEHHLYRVYYRVHSGKIVNIEPIARHHSERKQDVAS